MLVPIPALNDNYIWLYRRENFPVIVIDIPEITRLIPYLESHKLDVEAVLLTHNHDDHVQGVAAFKQYLSLIHICSRHCRTVKRRQKSVIS